MSPLTTWLRRFNDQPTRLREKLPRRAIRHRRLICEPLEDRRLLSWTVMAYIDADNNVEGFGLDRFRELASTGSTQDVNIVGLLDASSWNTTGCGEIQNGDTPDQNWGDDPSTIWPAWADAADNELNMGHPDTVTRFVNWAIGQYPADHYALIFWDHGAGAHGHLCSDVTDGDPGLTTAELGQAYDGITQKLDVLLFNACLMGMVEVAYESRDAADVMVASEELMWADLLPFTPIINALVGNPNMDGEDLANEMVDAFEARCAAQNYDDQTLAAIDLNKIGSATTGLVGEMEDLATMMLTTATSDDWKAVLAAHDNTQKFGQQHHNYYDLGQWMDEINNHALASADLKNAATAVRNALDDAVIDPYAGSNVTANGLSVYAPFAELNRRYDPAHGGNDIDMVDDTRWEEFVGPLGIDVVTVIDRSGSMSGDKINEAKAASKQFVDLMIPKDKIGVVSYSSSASTDFQLQEILTDGSTQTAAKAAINAISAGGMTSIGSGVRVADNQLDQFPDNRSRTMLVMSDGLQNTDPEPIGVINSQVDPNIVIYTIGFGQDADAGLLGQMAALRNGNYYFATSADLQQIYTAIAGQLSGRQQTPSGTQTLQQGQQATHGVFVDVLADCASFTVDWSGSDVDLSLIAPDGTVIDHAAADADPNISLSIGDTYEVYEVALPMGGLWTMVADGISIPAGGEVVNFYGSLDSPIQMTMSTDKITYETGETVHIEAFLTDEFPIVGATVTATVEAPAGAGFVTEQVPLFDDGAHGDGAPNDGVYANDFDQILWPGSYTIYVDAQGNSYVGFPFVRHDFLSIAVTQATTQPPVADAGGPYDGTTGAPITFDASGSYDPDGGIVLYEWDWDFDGVYDDSSTEPYAEHTWNEPFSGTVGMQVTDNEGLSDSDTALVEVVFETRFDFGTADSPVAVGYMQVTEATNYDPGLGHGWLGGTISSRDRGTLSDPERDLNFTLQGAFAVDVPNPGIYEVAITIGDTAPYWHDRIGVYLEGGHVDTVSVKVGQIKTEVYEVEVADGQLTLGLRDLGGTDPNCVINALQITEVPQGPDVTPPTVDIVDVSPDPRNSAVNQIVMRFSEEVVGVDLSDLALTHNGGANLLTGAETLATGNNVEWTLGGLGGLTGGPGAYALTLTAAGSGIEDLAGNPLAGDATDGFTVLEEPPLLAHFDFGTLRSPVAPGYMQVAKYTRYTGARGYGWEDGRIDDRDRGIGSSAQRDLNFAPDGVFAFDVPNGKYQVTVTVGDNGPYHHDQMGIFLEGRQVESVSTGVGEVATRTYEVDVADGQLTLGLRDLGGSDPNVCIEKLEVAQLEEGPDTTPPTVDIVDVTPDPRMTPIEQVSITFSEEVTGFDLLDLTLTRDGGPNLLTGAEPLTTPNNQHWTLAGLGGLTDTPGAYTLTLTTVGSGIADLSGNPLVVGATETFAVQEEQPFEAHYDFGTGSSPVAAGYTRVTETAQYSAAQQYGWQAGIIKGRDRGAGSFLERDLNFTTDATFAVNVPNGRYLVDLVLGDNGPYWHDQMGVWLEGALVDTVSTPANVVVSRSYNVDVLDGQLTLLLQDRGGSDPNVCINAMDVALLELFG